MRGDSVRDVFGPILGIASCFAVWFVLYGVMYGLDRFLMVIL